MRKIFSDFEIIVLKKDNEAGILLKARKPMNWKPIDLSDIELYSMILGKRTTSIPEITDMPLLRRFKLLSIDKTIKIARGKFGAFLRTC